MRILRTPNCTFDFYILPNVPPAGPDIQQASGYLHTWFFPGMQVNRGNTAYFFDSALDVELKVEADDPFPNAPGKYRVYIPSMLNQGYDVVFIERFRFPPYYGKHGSQDFKRIFLRRRVWSTKAGLITEGGLRLAGTATAGALIGGIGGLHLAGASAYFSAVIASSGLSLGGSGMVLRQYSAAGGLSLGGQGSVVRPSAASGGLHLAGTAIDNRPIAASGGLHLAGRAVITRPYVGSGGLHLGGKVRQIGFGGLHLAGNAHVMRPYHASGGLHLSRSATPPIHP
jgi:hypothetical protein